MVGWHHQLNGHEFEQTPGNCGGQKSLVCCTPWVLIKSDTTQQPNNSKMAIISMISQGAQWILYLFPSLFQFYKLDLRNEIISYGVISLNWYGFCPVSKKKICTYLFLFLSFNQFTVEVFLCYSFGIARSHYVQPEGSVCKWKGQVHVFRMLWKQPGSI